MSENTFDEFIWLLELKRCNGTLRVDKSGYMIFLNCMMAFMTSARFFEAFNHFGKRLASDEFFQPAC